MFVGEWPDKKKIHFPFYLYKEQFECLDLYFFLLFDQVPALDNILHH